MGGGPLPAACCCAPSELRPSGKHHRRPSAAGCSAPGGVHSRGCGCVWLVATLAAPLSCPPAAHMLEQGCLAPHGPAAAYAKRQPSWWLARQGGSSYALVRLGAPCLPRAWSAATSAVAACMRVPMCHWPVLVCLVLHACSFPASRTAGVWWADASHSTGPSACLCMDMCFLPLLVACLECVTCDLPVIFVGCCPSILSSNLKPSSICVCASVPCGSPSVAGCVFCAVLCCMSCVLCAMCTFSVHPTTPPLSLMNAWWGPPTHAALLPEGMCHWALNTSSSYREYYCAAAASAVLGAARLSNGAASG